MITRIYYHLCNELIIIDNDAIEVINAIQNLNIKIDSGCSSKLRDIILQTLFSQGWSSKVKLNHTSHISITAIKNNFGLCLQTGNMSRFYADLLKLQYLFLKGTITASIYIIPSKKNAKIMGSNLANFERMTEELAFYINIITLPIIVVGID